MDFILASHRHNCGYHEHTFAYQMQWKRMRRECVQNDWRRFLIQFARNILRFSAQLTHFSALTVKRILY